MKAFPRSARIGLLLVALTSCMSMPEPTQPPQLAETIAPTQTIQPTEIAIPTDLIFSTSLVRLLSQSGLTVLSVQGSTYMAMFPSSGEAAWIKTDEGIVEAVFFIDPAEARQIRIMQQPDGITGRYIYTIRAPAPTLLHDQTIDAVFPLYFTVESGMFMVTSSAELDKTLKRIFSER